MENSGIGKKIKILRITKDLSQIQLASMLGVKSYTVSDIERGRSEPDIDTIKKLCVIFDVTSDELLELFHSRISRHFLRLLEYKDLYSLIHFYFVYQP